MLRPAAVWLLTFLVVLAPRAARGQSLRVGLAVGVTGQAVAGGLLGESAFPLPPALDGMDDAILFTGRLSAGQTPAAIFRMRPGEAPQVVVAAGTPAPTGQEFTAFQAPSACHPFVSFWGALASADPAAPDGNGLFLIDGTGLIQLVVQSGDSVPGGGVLTGLGSSPQVGADGRVLFLAARDQDLIPVLLQRLSSGNLLLLLEVGGSAPGGGTIADLQAVRMNCAGDLMVLAQVDDGTFRTVLFRGLPGSLQPLLAAGDLLPDGRAVEAFIGVPSLGPQGTVHAVVTEIGAAGKTLLRIGSEGAVQIISRTGDLLADGRRIDDLGSPTPWGPGGAAWRSVLAPPDPMAATQAAVLGAAAGAGGPAPLLSEGEVLPAGGSVVELDDPVGEATGSFVVHAISDGAGRQEGLLRWNEVEAAWVATTGETVPLVGRLLGGGCRQVRPAAAADGQIAFTASLSGLPAGKGIFIAAPGIPADLFLAPGDPGPGGTTIASLDGPPSLTAPGEVIVAVHLSPPSSQAAYLVIGENGMASLRLTQDDPTPLGGVFKTLGRLLSADAMGRVAFAATMAGASATSGIFTLQGAEPARSVAFSGEAAPGGGQFSAFGFAPVTAGSAQCVFLGFTSGERTGGGIFLASGAAAAGSPPVPLLALARTGDAAPGGGLIATLESPAAGDDGTVAFRAGLEDGQVVILAGDASGLRRALGTGDLFPGGGTILDPGAPAVDANGTIYTVVLAGPGPGTPALVRAGNAGLDILLSGGDQAATGSGFAQLDSFGSLVTAGDGVVAAGIDLLGWSRGATVMAAVLDSDGDGVGDAVDCAPADGTAFAQPGTVAGLELQPATGSTGQNETLFRWTAASATAGAGTVHDLLSGSLEGLRSPEPFAGAGCMATSLPGGEYQGPTPALAPGQGAWFLIRARNSCGVGAEQEATRLPLEQVSCAGP